MVKQKYEMEVKQVIADFEAKEELDNFDDHNQVLKTFFSWL